MQGLQKAKCNSCGVTFMSENESKLCPTCASAREGHGGHEMGGCGCGHHH